ncbi:hypothetical protein HDE_06438 [Halotydeus destructor]|nr:hypothetical protein HDE_06438 [Halotydeus destructor]
MSDSDSEMSYSSSEISTSEMSASETSGSEGAPGPLGEGTPWRDLTDQQRNKIAKDVEQTFNEDDYEEQEPDYLHQIRVHLCAFVAERCRQFPAILASLGTDMEDLAYSQNPLRRDWDDGGLLRSKWTHHYPAMTAEEQAIAYHQGARYLSYPTPSYSALVLNDTLSPATATRLGRFRPHSRVPIAQLAKMPAAAPETTSPTMSPEYEAPQLDMSGPGSPLADVEMTPPTQVGERSPQRPEGALERGAKEWEDGMKRSEAAKAKELESIAKSQAISAHLDEINSLPMPSTTSRLLNGLPSDAQVSTDNFFDWLHQVDIPYDAAIDELPGKQLTTGEGQQVQVPEYDGRRHGGREFHKQARITGRIRAEVRDETRNVDFTDRRRARGLSPVPAGPRVAHNPWKPGVFSGKAIENAVTDRHYRASSEPIGNRDLRQLRPFYPNLIPPQSDHFPTENIPSIVTLTIEDAKYLRLERKKRKAGKVLEMSPRSRSRSDLRSSFV